MRALKAFVVIGGVVLILGTGTLVWLLASGSTGLSGGPPIGPRTLLVPASFRATATAWQDGRLVLLGTTADDKQMVLIVDPRKPDAASVLVLEPP